MSDTATQTETLEKPKKLKRMGLNWTRCEIAVPNSDTDGFLERLLTRHQGETQSICALPLTRQPYARKTEIAIQMLNMSHNEGGSGSDLDRVLKAANGGEMPEVIWRDDKLWDPVYCADPEHGSRCRGEE
jgi:hypothetical protein